ncbi:MAG: hypothetical protein SFZ03_03055 [Candidatus Melainabacteria bacterium]|nr:hypothetical protein [Candidatus Melainabacteria bacterium]
MVVNVINFDPAVASKTWGQELLTYIKDNHTGADGNITQVGLQSLFRSTVGSVSLTEANPNDATQERLTRDGSIVQRMAAHDIYDDGVVNGSVLFRSMFNAAGSDNVDFSTGRGKELVVFMGEMDLKDDGVINGSSLRNAVRDMWPATDGATLPPDIFNTNVKASSLNTDSLGATLAHNDQGGLAPILRGVIREDELLKYSFWGHLQVPFLNQNLTAKEIIRLTTNDRNANLPDDLQAKIDAIADPNLRQAILRFKGVDHAVANHGQNPALVSSLLDPSVSDAQIRSSVRSAPLTVIGRNDVPPANNNNGNPTEGVIPGPDGPLPNGSDNEAD